MTPRRESSRRGECNKKGPPIWRAFLFGLCSSEVCRGILKSLFSILCLLLANSALTLWLLLCCRSLNLNTSQFWVDQDTTAVLTRDNLLVHLDIQLALRWNLVEATTTSITLYVNDTQTIASTLTNTLEAREQTRLNLLLAKMKEIGVGKIASLSGRYYAMSKEIFVWIVGHSRGSHDI